MLLNQDYFTPTELTGYARTAALNLPVNQFRLAGWLPNRPIDDLVYRFTKGGDSLLSAAPYRSYDAEASIASRPGVTRVSGELPPISRKIVLGEYDRLRQRANPTSSIRTSILSDTERVTRQIMARLEVARGDALVNGSVTINENGVKASADFGRSGSASVTASVLWSTTASADPIADLDTWTQAYIALNGTPPAVLLTSTRVRGLLQRNAAIRAMLTVGGSTPTVVTMDDLNRLLDAFNLPKLATYDVQFDVAGSATRVIADNLALLLPPEVAHDDAEGTDLGGTFYGTTAESLDASYGMEAGSEAGIVAGVYREEEPISIWTKAAGIALPVLANANLCWRATVAS